MKRKIDHPSRPPRNRLFGCLRLAFLCTLAIRFIPAATQVEAQLTRYCYACDCKGWNTCQGCGGSGMSRFALNERCTSCGGKGKNPCPSPICPYR